MLKVQLKPTNLILEFVHKKSDIRMFVNFVHIQCKWEIWKLRHKIKHGNKYFTFQMILRSIVQKISSSVKFLSKTNAKSKFIHVFRLLNRII